MLVVCTANIWRSPLAEHLLRNALAPTTAGGARIVVTSAGTRGRVGSAMDPVAVSELRRLGGDPAGFRARTLHPRDSEAADLILTATREHRAYVLSETPTALRRTFTLLEFAHLVSAIPPTPSPGGDPRQLVERVSSARGDAVLETYDIPDPYRQPLEVQRNVADLVASAVTVVAAALAGCGTCGRG